MTTMDANRAAEIIAAYGGDAARWPDDERAEALQQVARHPALAAQRTAAAQLDGMLSAWAAGSVGVDSDAAAAATRVLAMPAAQQTRGAPWRWMAGTGIAAAIALGAVLINPAAAPQRTPVVHHQITDDQAFAMVFTPTLDEDSSI